MTSARLRLAIAACSRAGELRTITQLLSNRRQLDDAIHVVEHLPTETIQDAGTQAWLEGERYQTRGDEQTIAGLRLVLAGHRTAGAAEVNRQVGPGGNDSVFDHFNAIGLRELRVPAH